MKVAFVVIGVFVLILGGALIAAGPFMTAAAFYREEGSFIAQQNSSAPNYTTAYSALASNLNQAEGVVFLGVILTPIGGAVLAYGLISGRSQKAFVRPDEGEANRNEAESSSPAKAS